MIVRYFGRFGAARGLAFCRCIQRRTVVGPSSFEFDQFNPDLVYVWIEDAATYFPSENKPIAGP